MRCSTEAAPGRVRDEAGATRRVGRAAALLATVAGGLAVAFPAAADAAVAPGHRDRVAALRATAAWLAVYPAPLWAGIELPGPCRTLPDRRRSCPIAIHILALTSDGPLPHRCAARAVLPPPGQRQRGARRTSAHCTPLAATAGSGR